MPWPDEFEIQLNGCFHWVGGFFRRGGIAAFRVLGFVLYGCLGMDFLWWKFRPHAARFQAEAQDHSQK